MNIYNELDFAKLPVKAQRELSRQVFGTTADVFVADSCRLTLEATIERAVSTGLLRETDLAGMLTKTQVISALRVAMEREIDYRVRQIFCE